MERERGLFYSPVFCKRQMCLKVNIFWLQVRSHFVCVPELVFAYVQN